ncbi:MAG: GNAT family N-acetyltransferase [Caldilineaceae bacterium]|nr:GNAT family N-acetyltransferase [Caldilineaceae bacterium]
MIGEDEYTLRPPTPADMTEIVALMNVCEVALGDVPSMTVEELRRDWIELDLNEGAIVAETPAGAIVGYGDIVNRAFAQTNVYAFARPGRGQSERFARLVTWGEEWVATRKPADLMTPTEIHLFRRTADTDSLRMLEAAGYENVRTHYVMTAELTETPPAPLWPEGIFVRSFRPGADDEALFLGGEESFQDLWNRPPSTKERWLEPLQADDFDPTLWFLPFDSATGEVCGVCLCSILPGGGKVDSLGVRRPWRKQGLGLALLQHAFGELWRRGIRQVYLSVDAQSPTGAPRLYARAGFRVEKQFARYVKKV